MGNSIIVELLLKDNNLTSMKYSGSSYPNVEPLLVVLLEYLVTSVCSIRAGVFIYFIRAFKSYVQTLVPKG